MDNSWSHQSEKPAESDSSETKTPNDIYPDASKGIGAKPSQSWQVGSDTAPETAEQTSLAYSNTDKPVPVVHVLSVRGVEYTMMTLALWFGAAALIWILLGLVNSQNSFDFLAFPVSLLLVSMPVFALFFIRLRRAELANPALRLEASKRRLSQITQILAYIVCLFNIVGFVYVVMSKLGGTESVSIGKAALNIAVVLLVTGGILVYYWFDEHRQLKG